MKLRALKRGTGLSDHGSQFAALETRMEDVPWSTPRTGGSAAGKLKRSR